MTIPSLISARYGQAVLCPWILRPDLGKSLGEVPNLWRTHAYGGRSGRDGGRKGQWVHLGVQRTLPETLYQRHRMDRQRYKHLRWAKMRDVLAWNKIRHMGNNFWVNGSEWLQKVLSQGLKFTIIIIISSWSAFSQGFRGSWSPTWESRYCLTHSLTLQTSPSIVVSY